MRKQWKQWQDFMFLGSKITADGDCSHEITRHLLLGRKALTNLEHIKKQRDCFAIKGPSSQSSGVSSSHVWCESWTIRKNQYHIVKLKIKNKNKKKNIKKKKKVERQRIDAFELCVGEDSWESLSFSRGSSWPRNTVGHDLAIKPLPWTARRSNQSILKEITCIPVVDSFWYLAKLIQLCKV